jgi:hypothetical protein
MSAGKLKKKKQPTEQPTGKKSIEKKRAVHE